MMVIKKKCQVLPLAWISPVQLGTLELTWLERSFEEKNLDNSDV